MRGWVRGWGACVLLVAASAYAQVTAVGPVSPTTGFPVWYEDSNGLRLELCLDANGLCLESPPDPTRPASVPDNFTAEAFWWSAEATMPTNGGGEALLVLAWEAAFSTETPAVGDQAVFGRLRFRIDNLVAGETYRVIHPFGVDEFVAEAAGRRGINATVDVGCAGGPCDFTQALTSRVGPFLFWDPAVAPAAPAGYIGDPGTPHRVLGSPFGTNFFRIEGPNVGGPGVNAVQTDLFTVQGKVFVPPPVGTLGVSSSRVTYGNVPVGESRGPQAISLENLGNAALGIGTLALAGGNVGDFLIVSDPCSGTSLLPGASCVLTVSFTPTGPGARSTLLQIPSSDPASPHQVGLTGRGIDATTPTGSVGPLNLAHGFPEFYEDFAGLRLKLCLDADGQCLTNPPTPALAPSVPDNFPDEAFWWAADAQMPTTGDGRARLVLAMEAAFAAGPVIAGDQIAFGRVRVRAQNLVPGELYTVTHPFGVDTLIADVDGTLNTTEDLGCVSTPCNFAAPLDSRVTTFLTWDPAVLPAPPPGQIGDPGVDHVITGSPLNTNFFRIQGLDVGGPGVNVIQTDVFQVQGKVYQPVGPVIRLSPQLVDFGSVLVDSPVAQSLAVENVGTAPAQLGAVVLGGPAAADYVLTDGCSGQLLAAGGTCLIGVQFTPSDASRREATISVPSDASNSPQVGNLLGRGLAPSGPVLVPVNAPEFGAVRLTTVSTEQVVVTNGGDAPLSIVSAALAGPNAAEFSIAADGCSGATLDPAGTCTIQVQFAPAGLGTRVATLTLVSDDPAGPKTVALSGTGSAPVLALDLNAIDFGAQPPASAAQRSVQLTNTGSGPLNLVALSLIGVASADWSVVGTTCNTTLAEGESCSIGLSFNPTATGARNAALQIVTDAPNSPHLVSLSGEGLADPGSGDGGVGGDGGGTCIER